MTFVKEARFLRVYISAYSAVSSFRTIRSRVYIVMQLALGRKTGSANHPVCLSLFFLPFFFRDRPRCLFAKGKGALLVKIKGRKPPDSSRHDRLVHQKLIHMYAARTGQWREKPSSSSSSSPIPGRDPVGRSLRKNEYAASHGRILFYKIYYLLPEHYPPSSANSPQVFRAKPQT